MKRILLLAVLAAVAVGCGKKYETVKGDPLDAKIYTLKNGLTVYMTVNKDEPRIQTYIAVRAGGKDEVMSPKTLVLALHISNQETTSSVTDWLI